MISANQARKLTNKGGMGDEKCPIYRFDQIERVIKRLARLGFSNAAVYVHSDKVERFTKKLEKKGFRVWESGGVYPAYFIDVEW